MALQPKLKQVAMTTERGMASRQTDRSEDGDEHEKMALDASHAMSHCTTDGRCHHGTLQRVRHTEVE